MANDFVSLILFLSKEMKPVDIFLNSPGGSVNAGLVIYDLIQSCRCPVNIYCTGMAYSMGAVLLAGGQKGRRFILPHSKVMIHEPLITGGMGGSATTVKKTEESILEVKVLINELLSRHTGKSIEEIDEATAFDNFPRPHESPKQERNQRTALDRPKYSVAIWLHAMLMDGFHLRIVPHRPQWYRLASAILVIVLDHSGTLLSCASTNGKEHRLAPFPFLPISPLLSLRIPFAISFAIYSWKFDEIR